MRLSIQQHALSFVAWIVAGALTGSTFATVDFIFRFSAVGMNPDGWTWRYHVVAALTLYASLGALVGLGALILGKSEFAARLLVVPLGIHRVPGLASSILLPLFGAAFVALWIWTSSFTPPDDLIDWAALLLTATASVALVAFAPILRAWLNRRSLRFRHILAACAGLLGFVAAWLDMTVLVSLYPYMHAVAELMTGALWLFAFHTLLTESLLRRTWQLPAVAAAACIIALAVGYYALGGAPWAAQKLRHTATHHVYAGRLLARAHQFPTTKPEVSRRKPNQEVSHRSMSRHDERPVDACPSAWWPAEAPLAPSSLRATIPAQPNIVVFFVDTLRHDTASDPRVMPNLARFRRGALDFTRAYSTGSDTRSCLPAMIRGSYDLARKDEHDSLRSARSQGMQLALAIGRSPRQFLDKHVPQFHFDEVLETEDSDPGRKVWGYGAHRPTSEKIVNDSLEWLSQPDRKRFLLWQFHYDLHGWREMDEKDLATQAKTFGLSRQGGEAWKYRTVAASIDAEFGRFLGELEERRLHEDTVILFLADHGEGLGRQGFWLHSVFLWESLVRVPLVLHIPGLEPRKIDTTVSTMDVGPTLVRLLDPSTSLLPYHGEDLLTQIDDERPPRRFPILLRSVIKEQVARLGVIDPTAQRKLILPIESGQPELHDLSARAPDDVDIALDEPATVERLLPLVSDGPMNPRAWRKHERCLRSLSEPEPGVDTLATENRRVNRTRPWTGFADGTGDPT